MRNIFFCLFFFLLMLDAPDACAGGAVAKRQQGQKQMMQQKQRQQAAMQQRQMQQMGGAQMEARQQAAQRQAEINANVEVKQITTLDEMLKALGSSSYDWALMIDLEAKEAVVNEFIRKYLGAGITIKKPAYYYATMIDGMALENPEMLDQPFANILKVVAILEYDFDNGESKDAMALKVLGTQEAMMQNRTRLGM